MKPESPRSGQVPLFLALRSPCILIWVSLCIHFCVSLHLEEYTHPALGPHLHDHARLSLFPPQTQSYQRLRSESDPPLHHLARVRHFIHERLGFAIASRRSAHHRLVHVNTPSPAGHVVLGGSGIFNRQGGPTGELSCE